MRRQANRPQGFTLIEAAVAVGIIAILASAAAPLVMKALNQQREAKTREHLKAAFEAMFGSRDRHVANMRSDFGFDPQGPLTDLRRMTTRTPGNLALWGSAGGTQFNWGWNGPYWAGSTRVQGGTGGLPVDSWGRLLVLRVVGGGYQLRSSGRDGVIDTTDDLLYPPVAASLPTARVRVEVNVFQVAGTTALGQPIAAGSQVVALWPRPRATPASDTRPLSVATAAQDFPDLPPGSFQVTVNLTNANLVSPNPVTQVIQLMPGEQRTITMNFQIN